MKISPKVRDSEKDGGSKIRVLAKLNFPKSANWQIFLQKKQISENMPKLANFTLKLAKN